MPEKEKRKSGERRRSHERRKSHEHHEHKRRHSRGEHKDRRESRDYKHERRHSRDHDKNRERKSSKDDDKRERRSSKDDDKRERRSSKDDDKRERRNSQNHDYNNYDEGRGKDLPRNQRDMTGTLLGRPGQEQDFHERRIIDSKGGIDEIDYHEMKRSNDPKHPPAMMTTIPLPLRQDGDVKENHNNPTVNVHIPIPPPPTELGHNPQLQQVEPLETDYPGHHHERWFFFWPPGQPKPGEPGGPPLGTSPPASLTPPPHGIPTTTVILPKRSPDEGLPTLPIPLQNEQKNNENQSPTIENQQLNRLVVKDELLQTSFIFPSTTEPNKVEDLVVQDQDPMTGETKTDAEKQSEVTTIFDHKSYKSTGVSPMPSEYPSDVKQKKPSLIQTKDAKSGSNEQYYTQQIRKKQLLPADICPTCGIGRFKRRVTTAGYLAAILLFPFGTYACLKKKCCAVDSCTYCGHFKK